MEYLVMNYFDDDPYNIVSNDAFSDSNTTSSLYIPDTPKKSDLSESISSSTNTTNDDATPSQTIQDSELKNTSHDETSTVINNTGTAPTISEQNGTAPKDNINKPKLSFQCNICTFASKTRFYLARHHQDAHKTNIHVDSVQYQTNSDFKNDSLTSVKSLSNHPNKKICFRCDICDFSTNMRFALARHQLTHKEVKSSNKSGTSDLDTDSSISETDESSDSDLDTYYSFSDVNDEFGNIFDDSDSDKDLSASKPELLFKATKEIVTPKIFNCQKCPYKTKISFYLKQHEKSHLEKSSEKSNLVCSHCRFEGKSEKSLLFHLLHAHRELSSFCKYCDRIIPNQLHIDHTKKCKDKAIHKCTKCENFKVTRKILLKHQRHCEKLPDELEKLDSKNTLLTESKSCEGGERGPSDKVNIGPKLADSKNKLEKHSQSSNEQQYICNICLLFETTDKILFNEHLLMHIQSNQQIKIKPPVCPEKSQKNNEKNIISTGLNEATERSQEQENVTPRENCELNNGTVPEHAHEESNLINNKPSSLNKESSALHEPQLESIVKEESSVLGHLPHDELIIIKEEARLVGIGTGSYNCDQCAYKSKNKKLFQKHVRAVHMGKDFHCPHCSFVMKGQHSTLSHTLGHKINKPIFKCSFCDFKSFKRVVSKHSVQMHGKNIEWQASMINCPYCSFVCKNQGSYKDHVRRHILLKERLLKCEVCDYKSFKCNVIKHQNKCHVPPNNTIYRCTLCSFNTNTKANLRSHILRHTKLKKKLYSCTKCNFKSLIANAVRAHVKQMHGYPLKRKLKCDLCSYSVRGINKLARHKSYHATGSLTYKCNFCDYTAFMNTVKMHSIKEHNAEFTAKEKRIYLKPSNRKKLNIKMHSIKEHNAEFTAKEKRIYLKPSDRKKLNIKIKLEEEQIFNCDLCSYVSNFKYNLQLHIQKHRKNYPIVKCTDCDFKSFKSVVSLHTKHIHNKRIHYLREGDIYSCELCSFTAKWRSQFKNHYLLHTVYNKTVFSCGDCSFRGFRVSIIKHYRVAHGKTITDANLELKQKSFECSYCSYSGKSLDTIKLHELLHTEAKEPIYDCEHCDYRTTLAGIRRHSSKEHGIKFKGGLKRERREGKSRREINLNTTDKWHNCKFCSYTTPNYNIYKAHVEKHNDEAMAVIKCNYCDYKGFKTTVGKHIKAKHEVIFSCDKCSYSTEDKRKYNNHKSLHTSETLMYKCSMCDYKSISLVIRRHMIKEHPKRTKNQNVLQLVNDFCKTKDNVEKENVINNSNEN